MDIFSPIIKDDVTITGSSNANLLRVSSPSNANILFISGSGNVGIGTGTPLSTLTVAGGNINIGTGYAIGGNNVGSFSPFIRYSTNAGIVSSSFGHVTAYMLSDAGGIFGANDLSFYAGAVTQPEIMRIVGSTGFVGIGESSPSAKLEIKGSGATSATTALRVENSNASASLVVLDNNNVGIGTTNPLSLLHISASSGNEFLRITSGSQNILNVRSGSVVFFAGTGVAPSSGVDLDIQGTGTVNGGSVRIAGNGTNWGFSSVSSVNRTGTGNPEMFNIVMGGTSTTLIQNPLRIQFDANQNATSGSGYIVLRLNATHASTAGTGSKLLQTWEFAGTQRSIVDISGSIGIGMTGSVPLSASLHISGASNSNLLRIQSPASSSILFVTGSGRVGIGTSTPNSYLSVVNSGNIKLEAGDNVGIQILPEEWIHLYSDPNSGKYIRIDGDQISQSPPLTVASPGKGYGITLDGNYLAEPDYWMEIKLGAAGGGIVLIPCYLPE